LVVRRLGLFLDGTSLTGSGDLARRRTMAALTSVLQVLHVLAAILMVWPFYALVAVNERAGLGPPVGDRVDVYLESVLRGRVIPCFVFQGTVMATGLALILLHGLGLGALVANPVLGLKFLLLILIAVLLGYVHAKVQPRIDALFENSPDGSVSPDTAKAIASHRLRRKRLASICLFSVLTMAMLGVQAWVSFPLWLSLTMLLALALFTYRAYKSTTPYGWV
jgi:hypothetical protein